MSNTASEATAPRRYVGGPIRGGTTLVEMMIVIACFSVVALATYEVVMRTNLDSAHLNAWNQLTQWRQNVIHQTDAELTQSRYIYQNDALGTAYLNKLEADVNFPILATSLLPLIDPTGTFHQDSVVTRTGNVVLYVKEAAPFVGDADGTTRRVDIYYMGCYYLSPGGQPVGGKSTSLRLIKWQSREFADYNQVMAISQPVARTAFVVNLYTNRGIRYLWLPHNTPATAFYAIDEFGDIAGAPDAAYTIQKNTAESMISDIGSGYASIAWNRGNDFWVPDIVPKFALVSVSGDGFPHGFEVQIIGPSSARQILIRIVLAYFVSLDRSFFSAESSTIVAMHEF